MPSIESIYFDTSGWTPQPMTAETMRWTNTKQQQLSLHWFELPPDIPCRLTDVDGLRSAYREGLSDVGAALIAADVFPVGRLDCMSLIFKAQRQPQGMVYVGSLTFPFEQFSFVIKIECPELGTTGVRDAMVLDMLMQQGAVAFDSNSQTILGWASDPYDRSYQAPLLSNRSDDPAYDSMFPDHPLTDVRSQFSRILLTLRADEEIMSSARFVGPEIPKVRKRDGTGFEKPWWRFW